MGICKAQRHRGEKIRATLKSEGREELKMEERTKTAREGHGLRSRTKKTKTS